MIEIDHVSKRFGTNGDRTTAVDDLTLRVEAGEVVALVGSSGSGKTTTLRMINRLIEPTTGTITVDGQDVSTLPAHELRRGIGYVIQQSGLFPHRTVLANVATVPRLLGWDKAPRQRPGQGAARPRRTRRHVRRPLPGAALGRPAAARRRRSCARLRPARAVDGRAVRRRRPDRARPAAAGVRQAAARARQDGGVRHPRRRRGDHPRRPHRRPRERRATGPARHACRAARQPGVGVRRRLPRWAPGRVPRRRRRRLPDRRPLRARRAGARRRDPRGHVPSARVRERDVPRVRSVVERAPAQRELGRHLVLHDAARPLHGARREPRLRARPAPRRSSPCAGRRRIRSC